MAPFCLIQCRAAEVSSPPEKAMPTFWPRGRDSRITDIVMQTSMVEHRCAEGLGGGAFAGLDFTGVVDALGSAEEHEEDGLLGVHAVFGLVEDDGLRAVEDRVGDFGVAMRGEAVHEDGVRLGVGHEGFVDLIGLEDWAALGGFGLEPHAGGDGGVDGVGSGYGFDGVVDEGNTAAGLFGDLDGLVDDFELGREAFWRSYAAVCAELCGGKHEGG